jgi:uncharacterized membrane protein
MRARLLKLLDTLLSSFWFLPSFMIACTVGIYWFSVAFNPSQWVHVLQQHYIVYSGGFSEAKTILTVIAETMVTIASLVFTTVGVVITLATSQFGHRLIRSFMRDKFTQFAFGIFVSTFIYALLVLYTVRNSEGSASVAGLSVSIAFYLAIIAGITLIYFTNHIAQMISAPTVIADVGREMDETIDRTWSGDSPSHSAKAPQDSPDTRQIERTLKQIKQDGTSLHSARSGYIQTLDTAGLVELAVEHQTVIKMICRPGDYLFEGTPVAQVWHADRSSELGHEIFQNIVVGKRRTPVQDLRFAFNQIAEIEVRAMSPALNDPFTALDCVNRIGAGLARLAQRTEPSPWRKDEDGWLRLYIEPVSFDELIDSAFTPIRNYSRESMIVTMQMLNVLEELAPLLRSARQKRAVAAQATLIQSGAEEGLLEEHDLESAQEAYKRVLYKLNTSTGDSSGNTSE